MGTFHVSCRIENPRDSSRSVLVSNLLVDTGSELTWIPRHILERIGIRREKKDWTFVLANGQHITRAVGYAVLHVTGSVTVDEVIFAEPGDLSLLGARSLEGLNLSVDPTNRRLVPGGPILAATPVAVRASRPPARRRRPARMVTR